MIIACIIACIISFVVGALIMMFAIGLMSYQKDKKPRNNVHFYVTRDINGTLELWFGFPLKTGKYYLSHRPTTKLLGQECSIREFGLKPSKYDRLTFNDEPVEVFLNLED